MIAADAPDNNEAVEPPPRVGSTPTSDLEKTYNVYETSTRVGCTRGQTTREAQQRTELDKEVGDP